jgi:hypothetical protein
MMSDAGRIPLDFVSSHHYPTDALGHPRPILGIRDTTSPTQRLLSQRRPRRSAARSRGTISGPSQIFLVEQLQEASAVAREACGWTWRDGRLALEIELPPHAVAALFVEFAPS